MEIKLYKTKDDERVINKTLTDELVLDAKIKDKRSILDMVLILFSSSDIFDYNYCYIEKFHRYYFMSDVKVTPTNMFEIRLSVDPLKTYENCILNSECDLVTSQYYNKYYNDYQESNFPNQENYESDSYKSDKTLVDEDTKVLITIGGVKS
jgi:hypothetical protein